MKKVKLISILLVIFISLSAFSILTYAKDMEECYHCNKSGQFHCSVCNNTGEVVCDGCGGAGRYECRGEVGKGKCDNGYYVCPSCNGDGLSRPIPADGDAGPCGQCGGKGKLECLTCRGTGIFVCDRCNGQGKCSCQNGECLEARKIDYKCPHCKGTGFLLDGPEFPPEYNDGVHNVPEKGDHIITDHSTWTGYYYGTGETDKDKPQTENNSDEDEARDPATGRDYVWFIDVGSGVFDIEGQHIVIKRNGSAVSGTLDVKYNEVFTVDGITDRNTHVYLTSDGFKTELIELNGEHEYSVGNRDPKTPKVPFNVSMTVEYIEGSASEGPNGPKDPAEMRTVDFGEGVWSFDNGENVTAVKNGEKMSGTKELYFYDSFKFDGLDREKMVVYLRGENNFSVTLIPTGDDEFSIGRYEPEESVLAVDSLRIVVEMRKDEIQETQGDETKNENIPDNRNSDFDIITSTDNGENPCSAAIRISAMTEEQQKYYAGLDNEVVERMIATVQKIFKSAQIGKFNAGDEEFLTNLVNENGLGSLKDARITTINFDGHIDLGFPVEVKVTFDPGVLDGGTDIYVYHVDESKRIELLGKAEYCTYDDGSVKEIFFYTTEFSTFFTAASNEIRQADVTDVQTAPESVVEHVSTEENKQFPFYIIIIIIGVCAAAAAAAVVIIIVKKKKKEKTV